MLTFTEDHFKVCFTKGEVTYYTRYFDREQDAYEFASEELPADSTYAVYRVETHVLKTNEVIVDPAEYRGADYGLD